MEEAESFPDNDQHQHQQDHDILKIHLEWSDRQRRILSADGRATELYCATRGFPFEESELPHNFLEKSDTNGHAAMWAEFEAWKQQQMDRSVASSGGEGIVGAWFRTLFVGETDFTTHHDEQVYNVQTRTLFVDLRIPRSRRRVAFLGGERYNQISSIDDLKSGDELQWYARQHVFAGYSRIIPDNRRPGMAGCCVRHHCLDWNYVGVKRPVPNKWWIEMRRPGRNLHQWKEWAYATNDVGHSYYGEVWERLSSATGRTGWISGSLISSEEEMSAQVVIALRRKRLSDDDNDDGVLVVVDDHFNYCVGRPLVRGINEYEDFGSLVNLVDAAVGRGDFAAARAWLGRVRGGHGRISSGWKIDLATDFWREGSPFWDPKDVTVVGDSMKACIVCHGRDQWEVFESNLTSTDALKSFLVQGSADELQPDVKRQRQENEVS